MSIVFLSGLALRLRLSLITYFNPDEALHAIWSFGGSRGDWSQTWLYALTDTHPPLLTLITHVVAMFSRTEFALRMVPVLAGSLFPLLLFVWLRRVAGTNAGMAAMFLLTMAPHMISISAQLRTYTLACLFLAASLVALEHAIDSGRVETMWVFDFLLTACIWADYSSMWFVAAGGVYALLRLRGSSTRMKITWAAGQAMALGTYGVLFVVHMRSLIGTGVRSSAVASWLQNEFPNQRTWLSFPFTNTFQHFDYLMGSRRLAVVAVALFAAAVTLLWIGRIGPRRENGRALALLVTIPFLLLMAAAYAKLFPYGGTRHTMLIGVFIAIGIALLVGSWRSGAATVALWGALLLSPVWLWISSEDLGDIPASRNRRVMMLQCLDYMRASIPAGALILTENETMLELAYYEGDPLPVSPTGRFTEARLAGRWRVATREYQFVDKADYEAAMTALRAQYGVPKPAPMWVLDGGWTTVAEPPSDQAHPFLQAVSVFHSESP